MEKYVTHLILLFLLILVSGPGYAQSKAETQGKRSEIAKKVAVKQFPFNKATSVVLLSFASPFLNEMGISFPDDELKLSDDSVQLRDTLGHAQVREIVLLSGEGVDELNRFFRTIKCDGPYTEVGCYWPRNAVVFLDGDATVIAEMEICFECEGYKMKPSEVFINDSRSCMYDAMKKIFARAGIRYGVTVH